MRNRRRNWGLAEKIRSFTLWEAPVLKRNVTSRFLRVLRRNVLECCSIKKEFRLCINIVMLVSAIIIHWEKKQLLQRHIFVSCSEVRGQRIQCEKKAKIPLHVLHPVSGLCFHRGKIGSLITTYANSGNTFRFFPGVLRTNSNFCSCWGCTWSDSLLCFRSHSEHYSCDVINRPITGLTLELFLHSGSTGPWIDFRGFVNLDVGKITTLFSLTSN